MDRKVIHKFECFGGNEGSDYAESYKLVYRQLLYVVKRAKALTFDHLQTRRTVTLWKLAAFQAGTDTETVGRREESRESSVRSTDGGFYR